MERVTLHSQSNFPSQPRQAKSPLTILANPETHTTKVFQAVAQIRRTENFSLERFRIDRKREGCLCSVANPFLKFNAMEEIMLFSKLLVAGALCVSGAAMAGVQGLYQADCWTVEAEGLSVGRSINFEKETATQVQTIYGDLTCAQPAYSFTFQGPYTLAANGAADFTSASIQLTALDARIAASFSAAQLCGFADWEAGAPREVAGLDCGGTQIPAANSVTYDLVKEVEGGIVFGAVTDEKDGSTLEKRPTEVDETTVFKAVSSTTR
jgi:hypothetical protein